MKTAQTISPQKQEGIPENFPLSQKQIARYCERWQIAELAIFGSVLRDDYTSHSDIDILVTFAPQTKRDLFDLLRMAEEFQNLGGRKVDILTRKSVEQSHNWLRKSEILNSAQVIYAL